MATKSKYEKQMEVLIEEAYDLKEKRLMKALLVSVEELKRAMREKTRGQREGSI